MKGKKHKARNKTMEKKPVWIAAIVAVCAALVGILLWQFLAQRQIELPYLTASNVAVLDVNTGKFVYRDESGEAHSPASVTKLMTTYLILDDIQKGQLDWEQEYVVTPEDAFTLGSKYGMEPGEVFTVRQLMAGTLLCSGCDCVHCLVALSGGDETAFVERMNDKAAELGLKGSHFSNPTGIDAAEHYMTAEDIARLARSLLKVHPEVLDFTSQPAMEIGERTFTNSNRLVGWDERVLGLKTGTTTIAGYNLVTYGKQGNDAYIIVLLGSSDGTTRFSETETILDVLFGEGE